MCGERPFQVSVTVYDCVGEWVSNYKHICCQWHVSVLLVAAIVLQSEVFDGPSDSLVFTHSMKLLMEKKRRHEWCPLNVWHRKNKCRGIHACCCLFTPLNQFAVPASCTVQRSSEGSNKPAPCTYAWETFLLNTEGMTLQAETTSHSQMYTFIQPYNTARHWNCSATRSDRFR